MSARSLAVGAAYSAGAEAWQGGPGRIYDRLADVLVGYSPVPLAGRVVLDVGAGTGAATRAALRAGAAAVAGVDLALGMLAYDAIRRPPAAVADAHALPVGRGRVGGAIAAFSLNHLDDPVRGLREMARAVAPGGPILVSTYAADDAHPAKTAVEDALAALGWTAEPWYDELRRRVTPRLATTDRCTAVARAAGIDASVDAVRIPFPDLAPVDLVAWRLGMAQHTRFVAALSSEDRARLVADACWRLEGTPVLERSIVVIAGVSG